MEFGPFFRPPNVNVAFGSPQASNVAFDMLHAIETLARRAFLVQSFRESAAKWHHKGGLREMTFAGDQPDSGLHGSGGWTGFNSRAGRKKRNERTQEKVEQAS
jgi:hypothetical protein